MQLLINVSLNNCSEWSSIIQAIVAVIALVAGINFTHLKWDVSYHKKFIKPDNQNKYKYKSYIRLINESNYGIRGDISLRSITFSDENNKDKALPIWSNSYSINHYSKCNINVIQFEILSNFYQNLQNIPLNYNHVDRNINIPNNILKIIKLLGIYQCKHLKHWNPNPKSTFYIFFNFKDNRSHPLNNLIKHPIWHIEKKHDNKHFYKQDHNTTMTMV